MYDKPQKIKLSEEMTCRIFNYTYLECTRIVYRNDPNPNIEGFVYEVKILVGLKSLTESVLMLIYALLSARANNTKEIEAFVKALKSTGLTNSKNEALDNFIKETKKKNGKFFIDLKPKPFPLKDINLYDIHWPDITRDFDIEAIWILANLWEEPQDKMDFLEIMEHYYHVYNSYEEYPLYDSNGVRQKLIKLDLSELKNKIKTNTSYEGSIVAYPTEDRYVPIEQIEEKDKEIDQLKDAYLKLKSTLNNVMGELNEYKNKDNGERTFTLSKIVDYCKSKADISQTTGISTMLYKFIRNGSEEEEKLVDSIEEHFINRRNGDTYIKEQTVIPQVGNYKPEIQTQNISLPLQPRSQKGQKLLEDE